LQKLDRMAERRHLNHRRYLQLLADRFSVQRVTQDVRVSSISFGLLADDVEHRRAIVKALAEHGIETRLFSAGNLGLHPFWMKRYGRASFPMADRIHHCGFFLPNHPALTDDDVTFIARVVREAT
jgi:CDP-6-deoxy-D-xylo-4-hexulose-3-dehydrase